ncbi:uncharacterized protein LOC121074392 [Cygnus olor]|uniref:uncharacterized protein LOC121074392 n=1 Tax=Cygnus olor TaxID=8869 RepID=UPI001ADDFC18|nr:uncharacterized protein LOC121074392 [Cygnus olor]
MKLSLALLLAVALAMALFRLCGQGLCSQRCWERVRVSRSLGTTRQVSNWPCSLGLSSCPSRLRLRLNTVVPSEGPKQRPVGTERQPSELPDPLGRFWEYLAQGGRVWLLCDNWDAVCLLGVGLLALGLWRTVQRHRRQGTGRWASASVGTDRRGKDALDDYALLCRMEANTAFMVRCLRRLYQLRLQELGLPQPRNKALNKHRKRRAPWRSPGKFV